MTQISLAIIAITVNFCIILLINRLSELRLCAICTAISISWVSMLLLRAFNQNIDPTLLALLIGQGSIGSYYLIQKRLANAQLQFRLPLLLTLSLAGYGLMAPSINLGQPVLLILGLWVVFAAVYIYRTTPQLHKHFAHQLKFYEKV